jgi:hypothetical protein
MFLLLPLREAPGTSLHSNADDESPCLALLAFPFEISVHATRSGCGKRDGTGSSGTK